MLVIQLLYRKEGIMMVLKSSRSVLVVVLMAVCMLATGVQAETIVSKSMMDIDNPSSGTINKASADAVYQPESWAWRNEVRGESYDSPRKAYYKFDLSGITEGQAVASAELTFYFQRDGLNTNSSTVHGFSIYGITAGDDGWSGSDITWNNTLEGGEYEYLGNHLGRHTVVEENTVLLGTFTHTGLTYKGLEMTISGEALAEFLSTRSEATGLATFIIVGHDGVNFANNVHYIATGNPGEAGYAPTLTMETVPEPGTIALVAMGLTGAVLRRRRSA